VWSDARFRTGSITKLAKTTVSRGLHGIATVLRDSDRYGKLAFTKRDAARKGKIRIRAPKFAGAWSVGATGTARPGQSQPPETHSHQSENEGHDPPRSTASGAETSGTR
jgi:hypothetical protein